MEHSIKPSNGDISKVRKWNSSLFGGGRYFPFKKAPI